MARAAITDRRRQWQPTPVLSPGESHGRRSLVGYSPWGRWESDTTERLHFHFPLSCIGEGNGNPLQCSCLEDPRDGSAWWAALYGVTQSQTLLKRLSSNGNSSHNRIPQEIYFLTILETSSPRPRCQKSWFLMRLFSLFCRRLLSCLSTHGLFSVHAWKDREIPGVSSSSSYKIRVTLMSSIISLKVLFSIQLSWESELQHTNFGETIQSMALAQHFIQIYHFKPTGIYYLTVLFRQKSRLIFMFYVSQRWNHSFDLSCSWEVYSSLFGLLAESSSMQLKFPVCLLAVICGLAQMVKKLPAMKKTWVQSLGGGRSLGEGSGNSLQCSCLENFFMDRGARRATVHGVAKSQTWLSD